MRFRSVPFLARVTPSGGGGTPGTMTFGLNTGDSASMMDIQANDNGQSFNNGATLSLDRPGGSGTTGSCGFLVPDLSGIPAGATITGVSLRMVGAAGGYLAGGSCTMTLRRILRNSPIVMGGSPVDRTPGWINWTAATPWAGYAASGSGDATAALGSATVSSAAPGTVTTIASTTDLVAALQSWLDSPDTDEFILHVINTNAGDVYAPFEGGTGADASRPRLTVDYTA